MKFLETHFEEYIEKVKEYNLHPRLQKIYDRLPSKLSEMPNLIFYGPSIAPYLTKDVPLKEILQELI